MVSSSVPAVTRRLMGNTHVSNQNISSQKFAEELLRVSNPAEEHKIGLRVAHAVSQEG